MSLRIRHENLDGTVFMKPTLVGTDNWYSANRRTTINEQWIDYCERRLIPANMVLCQMPGYHRVSTRLEQERLLMTCGLDFFASKDNANAVLKSRPRAYGLSAMFLFAKYTGGGLKNGGMRYIAMAAQALHGMIYTRGMQKTQRAKYAICLSSADPCALLIDCEPYVQGPADEPVYTAEMNDADSTKFQEFVTKVAMHRYQDQLTPGTELHWVRDISHKPGLKFSTNFTGRFMKDGKEVFVWKSLLHVGEFMRYVYHCSCAIFGGDMSKNPCLAYDKQGTVGPRMDMKFYTEGRSVRLTGCCKFSEDGEPGNEPWRPKVPAENAQSVEEYVANPRHMSYQSWVKHVGGILLSPEHAVKLECCPGGVEPVSSAMVPRLDLLLKTGRDLDTTWAAMCVHRQKQFQKSKWHEVSWEKRHTECLDKMPRFVLRAAEQFKTMKFQSWCAECEGHSSEHMEIRRIGWNYPSMCIRIYTDSHCCTGAGVRLIHERVHIFFTISVPKLTWRQNCGKSNCGKGHQQWQDLDRMTASELRFVDASSFYCVSDDMDLSKPESRKAADIQFPLGRGKILEIDFSPDHELGNTGEQMYNHIRHHMVDKVLDFDARSLGIHLDWCTGMGKSEATAEMCKYVKEQLEKKILTDIAEEGAGQLVGFSLLWIVHRQIPAGKAKALLEKVGIVALNYLDVDSTYHLCSESILILSVDSLHRLYGPNGYLMRRTMVVCDELGSCFEQLGSSQIEWKSKTQVGPGTEFGTQFRPPKQETVHDVLLAVLKSAHKTITAEAFTFQYMIDYLVTDCEREILLVRNLAKPEKRKIYWTEQFGLFIDTVVNIAKKNELRQEKKSILIGGTLQRVQNQLMTYLKAAHPAGTCLVIDSASPEAIRTLLGSDDINATLAQYTYVSYTPTVPVAVSITHKFDYYFEVFSSKPCNARCGLQIIGRGRCNESSLALFVRSDGNFDTSTETIMKHVCTRTNSVLMEMVETESEDGEISHGYQLKPMGKLLVSNFKEHLESRNDMKKEMNSLLAYQNYNIADVPVVGFNSFDLRRLQMFKDIAQTVEETFDEQQLERVGMTDNPNPDLVMYHAAVRELVTRMTRPEYKQVSADQIVATSVFLGLAQPPLLSDAKFKKHFIYPVEAVAEQRNFEALWAEQDAFTQRDRAGGVTAQIVDPHFQKRIEIFKEFAQIVRPEFQPEDQLCPLNWANFQLNKIELVLQGRLPLLVDFFANHTHNTARKLALPGYEGLAVPRQPTLGSCFTELKKNVKAFLSNYGIRLRSKSKTDVQRGPKRHLLVSDELSLCDNQWLQPNKVFPRQDIQRAVLGVVDAADLRARYVFAWNRRFNGVQLGWNPEDPATKFTAAQLEPWTRYVSYGPLPAISELSEFTCGTCTNKYKLGRGDLCASFLTRTWTCSGCTPALGPAV